MLLALDTATTTASVALYNLETHQLLGELTWQARRRQTQDLLPALQDLLRLLDLTPAAITALAVTTGPGSFTGVRIAVSAAKGMALGLPQPPARRRYPYFERDCCSLCGVARRRVRSQSLCCHPGRPRPLQLGLVRPGDLLHRPAAEEHHAGLVAEFAAALAAHKGAVWLTGELGQDMLDGLRQPRGPGPRRKRRPHQRSAPRRAACPARRPALGCRHLRLDRNPAAALPEEPVVDTIFRPMNLADVPVVGELEILCFPAPWSPDTYRNELRHNRFGHYWVLAPDRTWG